MELNLEISLDLEMKELSIRNAIYSNYTYECENLNEVGEIVQEFINEYVKEK